MSFHESTACFYVSDTGTGIPPDQIHPIFEPFVQVNSALNRIHPGTGLGLAISCDLARLLGGDLTVTSMIGVGSIFALSPPIVAEQVDKVQSDPAGHPIHA